MMMTRRILFFMMALMVSFAVSGQNKGKFSPKQFEEDLENFIVKEARLTSAEQAAFLPLYREMKARQRQLFDQSRKLCRKKPDTEDGCRKAIKSQDKIEVEQKKLLQAYHEKFFSVISPCKVFDVIKAEDRFHRRMLKQRHDNNRPKERK